MKYWSLFSGGKDSITLAHHLASKGQLEGIVTIDTGISTPDHLPFVKNVCQQFGWDLKVYRTPESYDALVLKYGFPKPPSHSWFRTYLKGRCIRQFHKENPEAVLASGVRRHESKRRFKNTREEGEWEGAKIHSPIHDWQTSQVWKYVRKNNLPLSPTYKDLRVSGDCLCGGMAEQQELSLLRAFYPSLYARIRDLERKCDRDPAIRMRRWGSKEKPNNQSSLLCFEACQTTVST